MARFLMVLIIGLVCAQPVPAQVAEEAEEVENAEELAVREALRILQDRFNVRDKFSLVGDVDFEYHYMPEKGTRRPGVYSVARLAGLHPEPESTVPDTGKVSSPQTKAPDTERISSPVSALSDTGGALSFPEGNLPPARTLEDALQNLPAAIRDTLVLHPPEKQRTFLIWMGFLQPVTPSSEQLAAPAESVESVHDEPPDLLGVDASQLMGRNQRTAEDGLVLVLRRPPVNHRYREDITTAAQEYNMVERRLLRWDLDYLFESIPPEVSLFMDPATVSVQGTWAEVTVTCELRTMVTTPLSAPYDGRSGTLTLRWLKLEEEWRLEQLRTFVDQIRSMAGLQG